MPLTRDAKNLLAETIRGTAQAPEKGLRARLLRAIHDEADRRYRLSVRIADAGLDEAHRRRRERIAARIDEQVRACQPKGKEWSEKERVIVEARLLAQAEKEAAATLINRLVLLRQLEALGLSRPAVVTGGWNSRGYREFREFAPTLCTNGTTDATEGYATLLQLLFDELAADLPGLYGDVGLTRLFAVPPAMLREVIERLDDPGLASAWTDDTTLGWVYQYWNDPDREALDAKINDGGKIAPHEIASKTQMFTERYMVEWLLQNSLGLTWLCICKKHGWTPDANQVLPRLEARRVDWRRRRDAGEVALDALMPIEGELEDHWKYFLPQPIPDDSVKTAPDSVRALKLLDPAVGSGHFLVIAFGMLAALHREEARHRGERTTDREIAESILQNNLHGIDIDPRAIQIAAAGLYLKAKSLAKDARPRTMNLVAPVLQLGNLSPHDPARAQLRSDLKREVGIPEALTDKLIAALAGVDYLGSLLKVDAAVDEAIRAAELDFEKGGSQGDLLSGGFPVRQARLSVGDAKATILDRVEDFLSRHSSSQDLGLRLDGQQLAAGVRFVRMAHEGTYDVVIGNPPYQATTRLTAGDYFGRMYPSGKADLYAAFLERSLQLARDNGVSALLTMRGWMFLGQFELLRTVLLSNVDLRVVGDVDRGAFDEVPNELLAVVMSVFRKSPPSGTGSVALQPTPLSDRSYDRERTQRKRAALLVQDGRFEFSSPDFSVIDGRPLLYWWRREFIEEYARTPKIGETSPGRAGLISGDNGRFVRFWWETAGGSFQRWDDNLKPSEARQTAAAAAWVPFVLGGKGRVWFEPLKEILSWSPAGLAVRLKSEHDYGTVSRQIRNEHLYFRRGVAFTMVGNAFSARVHRYASVMDGKGSSCFPNNWKPLLALMNSARARYILESLNPSVNFQIGDVNRLPDYPIADAEVIVDRADAAFSEHESVRETSIEFSRPGPSSWECVERWAQRAVDRENGAALPPLEVVYQNAAPEQYLSFAVGVALGRFDRNGDGVLQIPPPSSLPGGILLVSVEAGDSLDHPACVALRAAWDEYVSSVGGGDDVRTYFRKSFFDYHKKLYENRPIYFPLSSAKRSFVAFVYIHRWRDDTLGVLLADHLVPARRRLEGELEDLRSVRSSGAAKNKTERRFTDVQKLLEELNDFIATVTEIDEHGPLPPDDKTPRREVDARCVIDLDDGVMVNSAALWSLLDPQWKDPKKWWRELAAAQGKKDYDWSHLAARYFPRRVREKCHEDPSLAVAHKCFWELHPTKAYAWELRLQDEIRPDFTIDEPASDAARARFLAEHEREAAEIRANEIKRRARKAAKGDDESENGPLFDDAEDAQVAEAADE